MNLAERERRLLYSCIVAGKSAVFTEGVMHRLFGTTELPERFSPLGWLKTMSQDEIEMRLRESRSGNYRKLARCLFELSRAELDLLKCTPADLEVFHGIGPKTSRFFIIWTRPEERYAALDVHVLRWLRERGHDAPRSTPSNGKYAELESAFIREAEALGMTPRELDSEIWEHGSGYAARAKEGV